MGTTPVYPAHGSSIKKRAFIAVWLFAFLCGIGAFLYAVDPVRYFAKALSEADVTTTVKVAGVSYRISRGNVELDGHAVGRRDAFRALKVAYAQTVAARTPHLSLQGTDPDILDTATNELQETQHALAAIQADDVRAKAVSDSLHPIVFLHAAAALERARLAFIESGSDADLEIYLSAQKKSVGTYILDLEHFRDSFMAIVPEDTAELGVSGGRVISRESELKAIDDLRQAMEQTNRRTQRRIACFSGSVAQCGHKDLLLPAIQPVHQDPLLWSGYSLVEEVRRIFKFSLSLLPVGRRREPSRPVELAESKCVGASSDNKVFLMRTLARRDGTTYQMLSFVGDILLMEARKFPGRYFDYFISQGVMYVPYWPTSTYTCHVLGEESGKVFAILDIDTAAAAHTFSTAFDDAELRRMEDTLVQNSVVREIDAAAYLAAVRDRIDVSTPTSTERAFVSLALELSDKSAGMSDFVYRLILEHRINLGHVNTDVPIELDAPYLFFVRSSFFSLFMGGNPSWTGFLPQPFSSEIIPPDKQPYKLYSSVRKAVPYDQLVRDIRFTIGLEETDI